MEKLKIQASVSDILEIMRNNDVHDLYLAAQQNAALEPELQRLIELIIMQNKIKGDHQ